MRTLGSTCPSTGAQLGVTSSPQCRWPPSVSTAHVQALGASGWACTGRLPLTRSSWAGGLFSAQGHVSIYNLTRGPYKSIHLAISLVPLVRPIWGGVWCELVLISWAVYGPGAAFPPPLRCLSSMLPSLRQGRPCAQQTHQGPPLRQWGGVRAAGHPEPPGDSRSRWAGSHSLVGPALADYNSHNYAQVTAVFK